jgi:RNA polymerase sigma-70 factor, ECF subfamily
MNDFCRMLEMQIPRLRRYARALTRDVAGADDLVQTCLTRAIAKQHLWQPGTDLRAWLFTMLHNQHVSELRRRNRERTSVSIDDITPVWSVSPNALHALELRDLDAAIAKLPDEQRQVILLVGLEGMRYDHAALVLGVPIGTLRSRLSRARDQLRIWMGMDGKHRPVKTAADCAETARRAA